MVDFNSIRFWAKDSAGRLKGIAGSTITVALATLARGLQNATAIDINATGDSATTVTVRNSGAGVANLNVDGNVDAEGTVRGDAIISRNTVKVAGGTAFVIDLTGTPTADRTVTFPDSAGTVALKGINNAFSTTQSVTGAVNASSTVSVQNNGSTQSITFSGSPTGNRVVTFPDADITIGPSIYIGSDTKANLNALPASATPLTAFCTDIAGVSGGVTGVQVYWSPATVAWLRYSNDSPI